jgi:uncharacterized protein (TIGR01777 family)
MKKQIILLAGGTGLLGDRLRQYFEEQEHEVRVLSRQPSAPAKRRYHWDPVKKKIDKQALAGVTVIINLSGAGIADKRWTPARKKELLDSRVEPNVFLAELAPQMPKLRQYVAASGINCYGYGHPEKVFVETDAFGPDFLSQLVEKWESAADLMQPFCQVTKVRISVVLTEKGGALETIAKPVRMGFGSPLGDGKQWMPWIHWFDLMRIFDFLIRQELPGVFNALGEVVDNAHFTKTLAKQLDKKLWMPKVPAFALKLLLGEMSTVALEGVNASNAKLKAAGFKLEYPKLENALAELFPKR